MFQNDTDTAIHMFGHDWSLSILTRDGIFSDTSIIRQVDEDRMFFQKMCFNEMHVLMLYWLWSDASLDIQWGYSSRRLGRGEISFLVHPGSELFPILTIPVAWPFMWLERSWEWIYLPHDFLLPLPMKIYGTSLKSYLNCTCAWLAWVTQEQLNRDTIKINTTNNKNNLLKTKQTKKTNKQAKLSV